MRGFWLIFVSKYAIKSACFLTQNPLYNRRDFLTILPKLAKNERFLADFGFFSLKIPSKIDLLFRGEITVRVFAYSTSGPILITHTLRKKIQEFKKNLPQLSFCLEISGSTVPKVPKIRENMAQDHSRWLIFFF